MTDHCTCRPTLAYVNIEMLLFQDVKPRVKAALVNMEQILSNKIMQFLK